MTEQRETAFDPQTKQPGVEAPDLCVLFPDIIPFDTPETGRPSQVGCTSDTLPYPSAPAVEPGRQGAVNSKITAQHPAEIREVADLKRYRIFSELKKAIRGYGGLSVPSRMANGLPDVRGPVGIYERLALAIGAHDPFGSKLGLTWEISAADLAPARDYSAVCEIIHKAIWAGHPNP